MYGNQITKTNFTDRYPRLKNRLLSSVHYKVLDCFDWIDRNTSLGPYISKISRRYVGGFLYSIKIELNRSCNLNCAICYVDREQMELPIDTVKIILNSLKNTGVRIELLGGEPLQYHSILEAIRMAKYESNSPYITLYTNAMYATPSMSSDLKESGLDSPIVTLISHDPDIHDEVTGIKGSWQETITGIQNLKSVGLKVFTFTAVHQKNVNDCKKIYDFVHKDLGVHTLFYPYIPQIPDDPLIIDSEVWSKIKHWILLEKNPDHANFISKFFKLTGNACSGGNFVLTVQADGTVQPCPFISDIPLGNVFENDIWDIYRRRFESKTLVDFKSVPSQCLECTYSSVCGGGCKAGNQTQFGSFLQKDPRCKGPYEYPIGRGVVCDQLPSFF